MTLPTHYLHQEVSPSLTYQYPHTNEVSCSESQTYVTHLSLDMTFVT